MSTVIPSEQTTPSRRRPPRAVVSVVAGLVLLAVVTAIGVALAQRGSALPGTRLGGLDVGGMSEDEVLDVARRVEGEQESRLVRIGAPQAADSVNAHVVGVDVDPEATTAKVMDAGRSNPFAAVVNGVGSLLGVGRDVEPVARVDEDRLAREVERIRSSVDRPVERGGFETTVSGTRVQVETVAPQAGLTLDVAETTERLRAALLAGTNEPVEMPLAVEEPGVPEVAAVEVAGAARTVLSAPFVLRARTGDEVALAPVELAPLLSAETDGASGLRLAVDEERLRAVVARATAGVDRKPSPARLVSPAPKVLLTAKYTASFRARKIRTSVEGGEDGLKVDVAATTAAAAEAIRNGRPTAELVAQVRRSPLPAARLAAVDQVIGSFTTYFPCCAPRTRNIARMAELVDGTVVMPGETFSLNEVAGPRTLERGFHADGAIRDGELVQEVGGGVSQFSTTLFNAVWFAGVESLQHQPHSVYISRYPPGREATLDWGSIENIWRNDTDHPIVVRATATGTSVTVALYGHTGKRVVQSVTGPSQPRPGGGFRVSVTRTVRDKGKVTGRDTLTWTYKPPLS